MILKILLLPFRAIFVILRAIFFPWYLRWIFNLHWTLYFVAAVGVGFLANNAYEDFQSNMRVADLRASQDAPEVTPLSQWTTANVAPYEEVNVQGIYFPALPQGTFEPRGSERGYILLADDRGREIKAVLAVRPAQMGRLQNQLAAQGNGEKVDVTVNGTLNRDDAWARAIRVELSAMNLPAASELVLIEPFVGRRAGALFRDAEASFDTVTLYGTLAGVLAALGLGKLALRVGDRRRASSTQSQRSARDVHAAKQTKQASQKARPGGGKTGAPSPWNSFDASNNSSESKEVKSQMVQPQTTKPQLVQPQTAQERQTASKNLTSPKKANTEAAKDLLPQTQFASVFPSGGSGFRFKSAVEIIRQSFGTLSSLTKAKRDD